MSTDAQLAKAHWNETPLFLSEEERYSTYPWLPEAAEFAKHAGERVLEVGCGTGCDLLQFAKNGAIATGIDITEKHLELARQRVGDLATVVEGDGRTLPFQDHSFDYVYSHGVLHHISDPSGTVNEILRVLRPGGRFNVQLYAKWSYSHFAYRLKYGGKWKQHVENSLAPVHLDLYSASSMRKLFSPIPIALRKYEFSHFQPLGRWVGWFIVGTGQKPGL